MLVAEIVLVVNQGVDVQKANLGIQFISACGGRLVAPLPGFPLGTNHKAVLLLLLVLGTLLGGAQAAGALVATRSPREIQGTQLALLGIIFLLDAPELVGGDTLLEQGLDNGLLVGALIDFLLYVPDHLLVGHGLGVGNHTGQRH